MDENLAMRVTSNQMKADSVKSKYAQRKKKKSSVYMLHLEVLEVQRCVEVRRTSCSLFLELEQRADPATQALVLIGRKDMAGE